MFFFHVQLYKLSINQNPVDTNILSNFRNKPVRRVVKVYQEYIPKNNFWDTCSRQGESWVPLATFSKSCSILVRGPQAILICNGFSREHHLCPAPKNQVHDNEKNLTFYEASFSLIKDSSLHICLNTAPLTCFFFFLTRDFTRLPAFSLIWELHIAVQRPHSRMVSISSQKYIVWNVNYT